MFRELAAPAAAFTAALFFLGVPSVYREQALGSSTGLMVFLIGLMWVLFRGYRARVLGRTRPGNLLAYLFAFLVLNHAVNFYCFLYIEVPVEFTWRSFGLEWFLDRLIVITVVILKVLAVNWAILGVLLRIMGARAAWGFATRIAIYSMPATLLVALPGAESWQVALAGLVVVQLVTLWRLRSEGALAPTRSSGRSFVDPSLLE